MTHSSRLYSAGLSFSSGPTPPPPPEYREGIEGNNLGKSSVSVTIVEDNPGDVYLLEMALKKHDVRATVIVITDGEKALEYVELLNLGTAVCPDLMVIDLNLPKAPGTAVLEQIRKCCACRQTRIVVLSSSSSVGDQSTAAALGANQYIVKPADLDSFLQIGGVFKRLLLS